MFLIYSTKVTYKKNVHIVKNIHLEIRLTDYESRQLGDEAVRRGMSKSELIRSLIARLPAPSNEKGA